ncbi:MAG: hypothetical protein LBR81_10010 [Prevotellaceae bacterium]|jgi:hypothetical protein|nr:hypothetical protein [Prevotellaceae bacterium]
MATQKNNVVTHGLSGKIGDLLVFRQRSGQTVVSKVPEQTKKTGTEKQTAHRKRFQQAIIYARAAIEQPETGEQYKQAAKKQRGVTALNVAVADFFEAPNIEKVNLTSYTGKAGDKIEVQVSDDFAVKTVQVQILNADGTLVENGEAEQNGSVLWVYTATQNNENLDGDKIIVSVTDLPGNITQEENSL